MLNKKCLKHSIGITGMGVISSVGNSVNTFKEAIQTGTQRFTHNEYVAQLTFPLITAALNDFKFEQLLETFTELPKNYIDVARKAGRRAPLVIQTSLIAALEAWQRARLYHRDIDPKRIAIVVAGQNTTQNYNYQLQAAFQTEPHYLSPTYALHFMDTDQVGTLSEVFNIRGEGFCVGGASASGNMGIIHAYRLLQSEHIDVCMVVGVLADLSPLEIQSFYNIGAMGGKNYKDDPNKASRPFDKAHDGFIWGQACGCLVLEKLSVAQKDEIQFLAQIAGVGVALDGNRLSDPNLEGESRAMQQALDHAGLVATDITYINAHGSSSVVGDEVELAAIRSVFGSHASHIWLNATKSLIGHCLWSAGVMEAIATAIQMQHNFVHPNVNLNHPIDNTFRFVGVQSETAHIQVVLSNSFGFGGINTSIAFLKGDNFNDRWN